MTPEQIELARHALGLNQGHGVSFRNHFVAYPGHADYVQGQEMVKAGLAEEHPGGLGTRPGDSIFKLTRAGAEAALRRGERLDPEDFPP